MRRQRGAVAVDSQVVKIETITELILGMNSRGESRMN